MFETDTAILTSDGKHSLPTWKKVGVCFVLIICFVSLYVTLSKLDFEKKLITQSIDDPRATETFTWNQRLECNLRSPLKNQSTTQLAAYVVISHTATGSCSSVLQCCEIVRRNQSYQMVEQFYDDIGYNFLIGSNQMQSPIYEGRGFDIQPDDFYNYKNNSFSVALIGNFNNKQPTDSQLESLKKLIQYGVENGKIDSNYTLLGHRQFRTSTDSPGQILYDIINKWDHWSEIAK